MPPALMDIAYAFDDEFLIEIQAREVAHVSRVFRLRVNRVCAVVHGGFQGRQAAGEAGEFGDAAVLGGL